MVSYLNSMVLYIDFMKLELDSTTLARREEVAAQGSSTGRGEGA
jgi:hypothetical protein